MTGMLVALALAPSRPIFTPSEIRSFPCGWHRITIDSIRGDSKSRASIDRGLLSVVLAGAERRRTIFLIVDGVEHRITASGPITVEQRVARHRRHRILFGTLIEGEVLYGELSCLQA